MAPARQPPRELSLALPGAPICDTRNKDDLHRASEKVPGSSEDRKV